MDFIKIELSKAIRFQSDLEKVKTIISQHPYLLRTKITEWGGTPLHVACNDDKDEIALFLVKEEKKRVNAEGRQPQPGSTRRSGLDLGGSKWTPSYNMQDIYGCSPVFLTSSCRIVEEMVRLDDLQVTTRDGSPLLWHCAGRGCVTERVASDQRLVGQYGQRHHGRLPLEEVINYHRRYSSCIELVKGLKWCKAEVKAMNLRTLLANSKSVETTLKSTWTVILSWLDRPCSGLTDDEALRLRATVMKVKGVAVTSWFHEENPGQRKLLWLFCCDGNLEMVKYMLSLPGIDDPVMADGTTAFSMALAQRNCDLISELLRFKRKRDIELARYALLEPKINTEVRQVLEEAIDSTSSWKPWSFIRNLFSMILCSTDEGLQANPCKEMIEAAKMYPYFNEDAERNWEEGNANEEMIQEMIKITHCRVLDSVLEMDQYKVHGISFKKQQGTSLPIVDCFQHSTTKDKLDCAMVKDLLEVARQIEKRLDSDQIFKNLKPKFTLDGSITEGTRFGYANELDLGLRFEALKYNEGVSGQKIAFKIDDDPFSLKRADTTQTTMDSFFNSSGEFQSHRFKLSLLEATDKAVTGMFDEGDNPSNLRRIVTNKDWQEGHTPCGGWCKRNLKTINYKHCITCPVTVSQTKIGLTLQFVWKWPGNEAIDAKDIYTSIDIILEYAIMPISAIKLAKIVNTPIMLPGKQSPPPGFIQYMGNYVMHYKVNLSRDGYIYYVVLKEMNFFEGRNHHVRPAQPSIDGGKKFSSERMKKMYGYIKFLKKNLAGLDLSSFGVKKELLKDQYEAILDSCKESGRWQMPMADDKALVAILSQPEFRSRVEGSRIDLDKSNEFGKIHFKSICDTSPTCSRFAEISPELVVLPAVASIPSNRGRRHSI